MNRHLRLVSAFVLACLVVSGGTGCGMMRLRGGGVESVDWPLAERVVVGMDPTGAMSFSGPSHRPSLLVRISLDAVAELIEQDQEPQLFCPSDCAKASGPTTRNIQAAKKIVRFMKLFFIIFSYNNSISKLM